MEIKVCKERGDHAALAHACLYVPPASIFFHQTHSAPQRHEFGHDRLTLYQRRKLFNETVMVYGIEKIVNIPWNRPRLLSIVQAVFNAPYRFIVAFLRPVGVAAI